MSAWAQAITQGLGRTGNELYDARQLALEEQGKKLALLQSQMGLKELQQRMGLEPQEFALRQQEQQRLQQQADLQLRLLKQPKFLGFQRVGGRVLYGLQNPDGTVQVKEAEGFDNSKDAQAIEDAIKTLPPGIAQQTARAVVTPYIVSEDYTAAIGALKPYLLQYGKSGLPGTTTTTDTTSTVTIDTPNGPQVVQVPKHTVTRRGVGTGGATPSTPAVPTKAIGPAKPTGDEMKRADLARNVDENLNSLEDIVKRRPDLFGPYGKGLLTEVRGWAGTNDPDIASLKQIRDNLGRALQGAHGMRAASGVESAANAVLNSFRNGPNAIAAAISAARGSVKTFEQDVDRGGSVSNDDPMGILPKKTVTTNGR